MSCRTLRFSTQVVFDREYIANTCNTHDKNLAQLKRQILSCPVSKSRCMVLYYTLCCVIYFPQRQSPYRCRQRLLPFHQVVYKKGYRFSTSLCRQDNKRDKHQETSSHYRSATWFIYHNHDELQLHTYLLPPSTAFRNAPQCCGLKL